MLKSEFPLLVKHPEIVYLDNAGTTQKPNMVIEGVTEFLKTEYANIHRGVYSLSEYSENHYYTSKKLVGELLNVKYNQIIYTANATASFNLLVGALVNSGILKKGDVVLVGIWDHHSNIVPWMAYAKHIGFEVRFFGLTEDYEIDFNDFEKKYTKEVKVVTCAQVSNVTGGIYDVKKIKSLLRPDTFFVVDGSQSVPNMLVDFQNIGCDALIFTAHKVLAYTGLGILILKQEWIKALEPITVGGGTVQDVSDHDFYLKSNVGKFESGTPNIIGAVSLEYAMKFIQGLDENKTLRGGMQKIEEYEKNLTEYIIDQIANIGDSVRLLGSKGKKRIALFSFSFEGNFNRLGELFAEEGICIRCGGHCAYPLHKQNGFGGTCRMSAYFYNDKEDIDKFFDVLNKLGLGN